MKLVKDNQNQTVEFQIEIEGTQEKFTPRLILKNDAISVMFEGKMQGKNAVFEVSKLNKLFENVKEVEGEIEVIVEGRYFKPWKSQVEFEVPVSVVVTENKQPTVSEPKVKVELKEVHPLDNVHPVNCDNCGRVIKAGHPDLAIQHSPGGDFCGDNCKKEYLQHHPIKESLQRACAFYKAKNGKWYMDLANNEYGGYDEAYTYGPFNSEEEVDSYLRDNFSNPGGMDVDDSGKRPVPKKSPNGHPVTTPQRRQWYENTQQKIKINGKLTEVFVTKVLTENGKTVLRIVDDRGKKRKLRVK